MSASQNISLSSVHSHDYVVYDGAGQIIEQGGLTHPLNYYRFKRPQSVHNPVRSDLTREPSSWASDWYRCAEAGSFSQLNGSGFTITSRGQLLYNNVITQIDPGDSASGQMRNTRLKALSTAVDASTQLNAALAQSRGIVTMSNEYLRRLNRYFEYLPDAFKSKDRFASVVKKWGRPSTWRKVPGDYLAYLYGIAPLGDDIANGLDRLTSYRLKGLSMTMFCRAKETRREDFWERAYYYCGAGVYPCLIPVQRKQETKAMYRFDLPSWYLDSAPTRTPFSTLYELAPYSFVLDWFLPVGHWVQALESAQFAPFFKEGAETTFIRDTCDFSGVQSDFGVARINGDFERGYMRRVALVDYPSSVLTRPSLKPFPGLQQTVQGLSLLAQSMQRWR